MFNSPFALLRAKNKPWLTLCCEHGGHRRPPDWRLSPEEQRLFDDHWGWDPGSAALTRSLAERLDGDAILGNWSRLVADLNRPPEHPDLCREEAEGVGLRFNQGLTSQEREARIAGVHAPYHQALGALLQERRPELLLSVHTFTPVYMTPQGPVVREVELGVLFNDNEALAHALVGQLQEGPLKVAPNAPYSGKEGMIYSAQRHGRAAGLPYLELEIRQDLLTDEASVSRISELLEPALRALRP